MSIPILSDVESQCKHANWRHGENVRATAVRANLESTLSFSRAPHFPLLAPASLSDIIRRATASYHAGILQALYNTAVDESSSALNHNNNYYTRLQSKPHFLTNQSNHGAFALGRVVTFVEMLTCFVVARVLSSPQSHPASTASSAPSAHS